MRILKKGDPEYISNGHYRVDGEEMMSIWTYKKKKGILPNDNNSNGSDSIMMKDTYEIIESEPDFGKFGTVHLFSVKDLNEYFSKK